MKKIIELAHQDQIESEAVSPMESAFGALELSEKDGSTVLSTGSTFGTAEVMEAWNKISLTPNPSLRSASQSPTGRGAKG